MIEPTAKVLAASFRTDAGIKYCLNKLSDEERLAFLPEFFQIVTTAAVLSKATIYEASSWQSCAIVIPPGQNPAKLRTIIPAGAFKVLKVAGVSGIKKMMVEMPTQSDKFKAQNIGKQKYYYVFFIATMESGRGKGLATKILKEVTQKAQAEGVPVWLEASSENSKRVYEKAGFEDLGTIILGKGEAAADGSPKKGGEGVRIFPMVWRPKTTST